MDQERPKVVLPFGAGIDRGSGQTVVEPATFRDVRNAELYRGRLEVRKGMSRQATLTSGYIVIAMHMIRSRSMSAVLVYQQSSGNVRLWLGAADGSSMGDRGIVAFVLNHASVAFPRFTMADAYDRLFIAHDEPDFLYRWSTVIWNVGTDSMESFVNWGDPNGPTPTVQKVAYFRGVASYLAYMIGWGWGQPVDVDPDNADSPEVLRISIEGDPTTYDPQHYFRAGIRGDAITGGGLAGVSPNTVFQITKGTQLYGLFGYDRNTFGVRPIEDYIGQPTHRLGVTVGGVRYFWSPTGPRRSNGGPSEDLGLDLALLDPPPDALAATLDTATGFAVFDPVRRVVQFVFGQWAFCYHLLNDPPKWSYRKYAVALGAGAVFVESSVGTLGPNADYVLTFSAIAVPGDLPDDISITLHFSFAGPHDGSEKLEIWARHTGLPVGPPYRAWQKIEAHAIAGAATYTPTKSVFYPGSYADVAARITKGGIPQVGSTGSPETWAHYRANTLMTLATPVVSSSSFAAGPVEPFTINLTATVTESLTVDDYMTYVCQISDGAGGWINLDTETHTYTPSLHKAVVDLHVYTGLTRDVRIRRTTTTVDSGWATIVGVVIP